MRRLRCNEGGAAALLTAAAMVFVLGAAALAVDLSGYQHSARTGQNTADMSCLAGVAEDTDGERIEMAASFARQNWPLMAGKAVTYLSASTGVLSSGSHSITFQASYGGDPDAMRVVVSEANDAGFGALFTDTVNVSQSAVCGARTATTGPRSLPLGTLAGTFSGDLFDCAAKVTGNCGAIRLDGSGGDDFRDGIAEGSGQDVEKHHGPRHDPDPDTGHPYTACPDAAACSGPETETGNMVGPFAQGIAIRLSDTDGADCTQALGTFNCDSISQVLGGSPQTLGQAFGSGVADVPADFPSSHFDVTGWQASLYGPYEAAKDQQYWYDGSGIKCDSPRLATVPIVVSAEAANKGGNGDWDLGDPATTWPNGNGSLKIVGFYTAYIRLPSDVGDLGGGVEGDVVWFGPNATCEDGTALAPVGARAFTSGVRLTNG